MGVITAVWLKSKGGVKVIHVYTEMQPKQNNAAEWELD